MKRRSRIAALSLAAAMTMSMGTMASAANLSTNNTEENAVSREEAGSYWVFSKTSEKSAYNYKKVIKMSNDADFPDYPYGKKRLGNSFSR